MFNAPKSQLDTLDLPSFGSQSVSRSSYTLDQIAHQLTDGYWSYNGESRRAFDVGPGGTLSYDASALSGAEQKLVIAAFQAWTDVTGIKFQTVSTTTQTLQEQGDIAGSTATTATLKLGQTLHGNLSVAGDEDWVKVQLQAGKTYHFAMVKGESGGLADPYLDLYNASGTLITYNDDRPADLNSEIAYTATKSGTYFIAASTYGTGKGTYDLQMSGTSISPDITFRNAHPDGGAFSTSETSGNTITSSFVNVEKDWDADPISINSYWFQTYVHEIGHALGLGHAGNYNGTATWGTDNSYSNDSWMSSVMSYFSQTDNPNVDADYAYLATVMPADIIAIQALYGSNVHTRNGDTTYGSGGTVAGYLGNLIKMALGETTAQTSVYINNPIAFTLFDTGGVDTINLSPISAAQVINLNQGVLSSVAGVHGNMVIARGTVIENAIGGSGADLITGNATQNSLSGLSGADKIWGAAGGDTLNGGAGNDRLDGGTGLDTAAFSGSTNIRASLAITAAQDTGLGHDILLNIENLISAGGNDRLTGNQRANILNGGEGNDSLYGGAGNDTLRNEAGNDVISGGQGTDTIVFLGAVAVTINLNQTTAQTTGYGRDVITGVEAVLTGNGADILKGNDADNLLNGGFGNDDLFGAKGGDRLRGGNGNDLLYGGAGDDTLSGGAGIDDFRINGGADWITDFRNDIDDIHLSRSLWGGGARTMAQILDFATVVGTGTKMDFGHGNTLWISGLTSLENLSNDILTY